MSFLYPSFLFALTSLSIPIIVHLFNFRRYKKIYFTNVKFLKEIQQESKAKSTLKRLLILASRLLALGCLVIAFAQPYLPGEYNVKKGARLVNIYIDNSFSMQAVNKSGNLLEDAKRKAKEIVQAASASDKFRLITNDFEAAQLTISKEQIPEAIERVQISTSVKDLTEIYGRMKSNPAEENNMGLSSEYFLLSDFQKSTFNKPALKPDTTSQTTFVYLENPAPENVYIDSCFVESPYFQQGSTQKLHIKIKNESEKEIENGSLKLYLNGKQITPLSFKASPKSSTDAILSFTCKDTGIQQGALAIEDFPVTFDDTLYFSFRVNSRVPCLVVNKKDEKAGAFLQSLFLGDSLFNYKEQNDQNIDYSAFTKSNLIVVNGLNTITSGLAEELKKYVLAGGSVLIFPAKDAEKESYNNFMNLFGASTFVQADTAQARLDSKSLPKSLYEGVFEKATENMDMPKVNYHFVTQSNSRSGEEVLLKLINGQKFLSMYNKGRGRLYVCTAPLDEKSSSFAKHALFVPTLIKIAVLSRPSPPLYYFNGNNEAIDVSTLSISGENPWHINSLTPTLSKGEGGIQSSGVDFIPEIKVTENSKFIFTHSQPAHAGNYLLTHEKNSLNGLAFNYKRTESNLNCYSKTDLDELVKNAGWKNVTVVDTNAASFKASLADLSGGTKLWKLFVLLTLLFLLAETALIKFMR